MTDNSGLERLDRYLVRRGLAPSRRVARESIEHGRVRVNGRRLPKGASVAAGDHVELVDPVPPLQIIANPAIVPEVLFADAALVVVNKPGGLPCHPLRPDERATVINGVAALYPETAFDSGKPLEGGLVHRLDNGTSGALIIARTPAALIALRSALKAGAIRREYHALVAGHLAEPVEVSTPIAHHPKNPRKMVTAARDYRGRPAATTIIPLRRQGAFTLVKALPSSGSRHQIRVHLASIGHPIVGDELYGGGATGWNAPPPRFWLHLAALELDSPAGGRVQLEAPLPADLQAALRVLG